MEKTVKAPTLKKSLTTIHLWAIAVGLVISGDYFGWNYGWGEAGTIGFLVVTGIVALMYVTFIFSFTELTAAIPNAGGPFAYALKAYGPYGGIIAGYATLIEFLFAAPAIALALGSYAHFLSDAVPVLPAAIFCFIVFTFLNVFGIKESAAFSLFVTLLAVAELLIFMGIVAPHFSFNNFIEHALPFNGAGLVRAIPFAIWFFLAIEGVAMVAEEVKDPDRHIPRGYSIGIITLVFLAFGVMVFAGGVGDWRTLASIDYPLPGAIAIALGRDSSFTNLFTSLGLFGLVASFHSIILTYSRQLFALARKGFLPPFMAQVNSTFKTPHYALLVGAVVGIIALCTGATDKLIILSVIGALAMYIISMMSLFTLRKNEPFLARPMLAPLFPFFPGIALLLSVACLIGVSFYNPFLLVLFLGGLLAIVITYRLFRSDNPEVIDDLYRDNGSSSSDSNWS
jgi:ethanolamine permease